MSVGRRSGLNWMRLKLDPRDRARERANSVFPEPGRSLSRRCPPASRLATLRRITSGGATTALETFRTSLSEFWTNESVIIHLLLYWRHAGANSTPTLQQTEPRSDLLNSLASGSGLRLEQFRGYLAWWKNDDWKEIREAAVDRLEGPSVLQVLCPSVCGKESLSASGCVYSGFSYDALGL